MKKYLHIIDCLTVVLIITALSSCTLFIEDEIKELESDTNAITHKGYGYDEPVTEKGKNYEVTYQYMPNVRTLDDETQQYIVEFEKDPLEITYLLYFDKNTPTHLLPRKGEMIMSDFTEKIEDGLMAEVLAAAYIDGYYTVGAVRTSPDKVFKEFNSHLDFFYDDIPEDEDNSKKNTSSSKVKGKNYADSDDDLEDVNTTYDSNTNTTHYQFTIPIYFDKELQSSTKGQDKYTDKVTGYTSGHILIDRKESRIKNDMALSIDLGLFGSKIYFKNTMDMDVTVHLSGEIHSTVNIWSKKRIRGWKIPKLPITIAFGLRICVPVDTKIGLAPRFIGNGNVVLDNQGMEGLGGLLWRFSAGTAPTALTVNALLNTPYLFEAFNQTKFDFSRSNLTGYEAKGEVALKIEIPINVGFGSQKTGVVVQPSVKHAVKLNHTNSKMQYGIDVSRHDYFTEYTSINFDLYLSFETNVINYIRDTILSLTGDVSLGLSIIKAEMKALDFAIKTYIANLPEDEQESFKNDALAAMTEAMANSSQEVSKLVKDLEKTVEETAAKVSNKTGTSSILPFEVQIIKDFEIKKWNHIVYYYYPKLDDKKSLYYRTFIDYKNKKQDWLCWLTFEDLGNLKSFLPYLQIHKIVDGEETWPPIILKRKGNGNIPITDEFNKKQSILFEIKGLDFDGKYRAYPCYAYASSPENILFYDKALTFNCTTPSITLDYIKNFKRITRDYGQPWYSFDLYLTVKTAGEMQNYTLTVKDYTDQIFNGTKIGEKVVTKPKDGVEIKKSMLVYADGVEEFTIDVNASIKEESGVTKVHHMDRIIVQINPNDNENPIWTYREGSNPPMYP